MSATDNIAANFSKIAFTDYFPTDKIIGVFQGSFNPATDTTTLAGGSLFQYSFSHSFSQPVLCEILISSDGVTYYDGNVGFTGAAAIAKSSSSTIYIITNVNGAGTLYYKILCSWIGNYDSTNPGALPVLQNLTNRAFFDSRYNYQKIFKQDTLTASTINAHNILTVDHNLGYTPNYKVYVEAFPGECWPQSAWGTNNFWRYDATHQSGATSVINNTQLKIDCSVPSSGSATRVWYRVYFDQ